MAKIYDFQTGLDFSNWAAGFDGFHDWVLMEVRVFAAYEVSVSSQFEEPQYNAEMVLFDPYGRFQANKVHFRFEDVESLSAGGLTSLNSALSELVFERTPRGIRVVSSSENQLSIEAGKLTVSTQH